MNDVKFLIRSALYYIFACKSHTALFRAPALKLDGPALQCSLDAVRSGAGRSRCVQCDGTGPKWQTVLFFIVLVYRPAGGVMVDV
jgi:hypothetical protein